MLLVFCLSLFSQSAFYIPIMHSAVILVAATPTYLSLDSPHLSLHLHSNLFIIVGSTLQCKVP